MIPYIAEALKVSEAEVLGTDKKYHIQKESGDIVSIRVLNQYGQKKYGSEKIILDANLFDSFFNEKSINAIKMKGDSMHGYLEDGDIALFERIEGLEDLEDGKYVVQTKIATSVKNLKFHIDGSVTISSENPSYPPETVTSAGKDFDILGRVIGRILRN